MILEQPPVSPQAPIDPDAARAALRTGKWDDQAALELVCQDAVRAENYENQKQWVMQWPTAATLYQSPFQARYWDGTQTERANIPFFTVATAVNSLAPQIVNGMFYENPPFIIQPRPGTKSQAARAISALLGFQLDEIGFREELRLGTANALLFGTSIWKWGWESFTQERKRYRRKAAPVIVKNPLSSAGAPDITVAHNDEDIEEEILTEYVDRPCFEHIVNLRHVLVDPALNVPDIRKAKYVIHRLYLTWEELDKLRDRPGYKIPSREELLELFLPPVEQVEQSGESDLKNPTFDARAEARYDKSTIDPFNQPLEVLERWDGESVIAVLQKKLVICNDDNQYGTLPFLSCNWWDVPEAFWGMGLAKTIGAEQRLQQGITNAWLDQVALNLNGVYKRKRGKSVPTQSIRIAPGRIIDVDDPEDITPLERTPQIPEAAEHLNLSQSRAEQVSGASDPASSGIAGPTGHSNMARSSAGAQILAAGASNRVSDFVEKLADQVMVPFLYAMVEMDRALLPMQTLRQILSDELQHEFMQDEKNDLIELLNARIRATILAAAKMQARRNMAQALPIMIQFLTNQQTENQLAVQGLKVDITEIMRMMFEVSDWKNFNDVVKPMSPEDQQRWQQMQPSAQVAAKTQAQQQMQQQQFANKSQLVDQENIARAGREVMRQALERSSEPFAVEGQAGGKGFGSNS